LLEIPGLSPARETGGPPQMWLDYFSELDWYAMLTPDLYPTSPWIELWNTAVLRTLSGWIVEVGDWAVGQAEWRIDETFGFLPLAFSTFSDWIVSIAVLVGTVLPSWARDALDGLKQLWERLPVEIRELWIDWYTWINGFVDEIKTWAQNRYDLFVDYASSAYDWVVLVGDALRQWKESVEEEIQSVADDPIAWVEDKLGDAWVWLVWFFGDPASVIVQLFTPHLDRLLLFSSDCLTFWYDLWGSHSDTLASFLNNPLGWIYDRVEDELIDRW
jgi:hypothetical protein